MVELTTTVPVAISSLLPTVLLCIVGYRGSRWLASATVAAKSSATIHEITNRILVDLMKSLFSVLVILGFLAATLWFFEAFKLSVDDGVRQCFGSMKEREGWPQEFFEYFNVYKGFVILKMDSSNFSVNLTLPNKLVTWEYQMSA